LNQLAWWCNIYNMNYICSNEYSATLKNIILCRLLTCWFLLKFSSTLKMEAICSSERRLHLNRLHGVTSQKMILFITTAVKTSNPTYSVTLLHLTICTLCRIVWLLYFTVSLILWKTRLQTGRLFQIQADRRGSADWNVQNPGTHQEP
jgi:hypothetical protein